jgi:hypothetical protein
MFKKWMIVAVTLLLIALSSQVAFATDYLLDNDHTTAWGYNNNNGNLFSYDYDLSYCYYSDIRYAYPVSSATGSYQWIFTTQNSGSHKYYVYCDGRNFWSNSTAARYYIGSTYKLSIDQMASTGSWYLIWDAGYQGNGVSTTVKVSNQSTDLYGTISADAAKMVGP